MKDLFANLYNKVLSFFHQAENKDRESAKDVACNRLKLVLMQDRTNLSPAIMDRMRQELIDLLSKYLELDKELLDLKVKNLKQKQEKFLQGRKNHWKKEETMLVNQANKEVEKDEKAIEHLEKKLKLAKEAKSLASNMKEESINIKYMESNTKKSILPPLESPKSSTSRAIEHRQRAILNHKIYTRLHRSKSQLT